MFYHEHDYTSVSSSERSVHSLYAAQPVNTGSTILILLALHEMQAVTGGTQMAGLPKDYPLVRPAFFIQSRKEEVQHAYHDYRRTGVELKGA
jgi:hypothetical protein